MAYTAGFGGALVVGRWGRVEFLDEWFSVARICQYFRTRSPVTMPDIDGWHARDLIAPLFFNDNTELHYLIRRRLILSLLLNRLLPPIFH
jgi:hypothetical protein